MLINIVKADDLVSNVSIIVNGTNIDLNNNPVINLNAGDIVPIEISFSGEKDINGRLKIKASIDAYTDIISDYNIFSAPVIKGVNGYNSALSLSLPDNITTGSYILQIEFYSKDESQTINYNIFINGLEPIEVKIIEPKKGLTYYNKSLILTVETDRNALCEYQLIKSIDTQENLTTPKNISITGQKNHSEIINNLFNTENFIYGILVICTDEQGAFGFNGTNFRVNLSEPTITLIFPENAYSTKSNKIIFRYNTKDELSNIANCSLIIDNETKDTNFNIKNDDENQFLLDLTPNDYTWKIICTNTNGIERSSETREFIIKEKKYVYNTYPDIDINNNYINETDTQKDTDNRINLTHLDYLPADVYPTKLNNQRIASDENNYTLFILISLLILIVLSIILIIFILIKNSINNRPIK